VRDVTVWCDLGIQRRAELFVLAPGRFTARLMTLHRHQPAASACITASKADYALVCKTLKSWGIPRWSGKVKSAP